MDNELLFMGYGYLAISYYENVAISRREISVCASVCVCVCVFACAITSVTVLAVK